MHIWFSATMKVSSAIEPGLVARKVLGGMQGPEQVARRYRPVHVAVQQSLELRWQRTRWTWPWPRSGERRVGKEWVSAFRSRAATDTVKKHKQDHKYRLITM